MKKYYIYFVCYFWNHKKGSPSGVDEKSEPILGWHQTSSIFYLSEKILCDKMLLSLEEKIVAFRGVGDCIITNLTLLGEDSKKKEPYIDFDEIEDIKSSRIKLYNEDKCTSHPLIDTYDYGFKKKISSGEFSQLSQQEGVLTKDVSDNGSDWLVGIQGDNETAWYDKEGYRVFYNRSGGLERY